MELGLTGRVAVVTGGSRGIGAATVERLRAEGARAIAVARSADGEDAVAADLTRPEAVEAIRAALEGRAPDILVNGAGTSYLRALEELSDDEWRAMHELHVLAPLRLMRAFAPEMAQRGWGRIVTVSSSAGKRPSLTNAAYSVTKAAALSLSRVFAERYTGSGVLVNAVAPGPTASELWTGPGGLAEQQARERGTTPAAVLAEQAKKLPLGRMTTPEEIAAVIVFLCSEQASAVAGAAWSVDGGHVQTIV